MKDVSKQALVILVFIAGISSVIASVFTIVAIDKVEFVQDFYENQLMADYLANPPSGTVALYVEPEPTIKGGEVHLEVK